MVMPDTMNRRLLAVFIKIARTFLILAQSIFTAWAGLFTSSAFGAGAPCGLNENLTIRLTDVRCEGIYFIDRFVGGPGGSNTEIATVVSKTWYVSVDGVPVAFTAAPTPLNKICDSRQRFFIPLILRDGRSHTE